MKHVYLVCETEILYIYIYIYILIELCLDKPLIKSRLIENCESWILIRPIKLSHDLEFKPYLLKYKMDHKSWLNNKKWERPSCLYDFYINSLSIYQHIKDKIVYIWRSVLLLFGGQTKVTIHENYQAAMKSLRWSLKLGGKFVFS